MIKYFFIVILISVVIVFIILGVIFFLREPLVLDSKFINVSSPFLYNFKVEGELHETGSMQKSKSPYWWLNSGGVMTIKEGSGQSNQGDLTALSKWRILYNLNNPIDTDGGYHPQNIFRLVTKSSWQDFSEEAIFKINKINLSQSPNRNVSNGVLLFLRYKDGNNLYYVGVRVDGTGIIKKKVNGEYFTLAQEKIFEGQYHRHDNPNLLPLNTWFGIRAEIKNIEDQSVAIKLFVDPLNTEEWQLVLQTIDDATGFDGLPINNKGFAGIRTDFMDVEFREFKIVELPLTL